MNDAWETYLKTYSAVNKIDQMLLNWNVSYHSWKWWHAPAMHAKAIAMSMAYSLYVQCAEGGVDPEWETTPVSATKFRHRLSSQMVNYKASNLMYPGDDKMRGATQMRKGKRGINETLLVKCKDIIRRVSYSQYLHEKTPWRGKKTRLCANNMHLFKEHMNSMKKIHKAACQMCGDITYMKCGISNKHICLKSNRASMSTVSCCVDFHDDQMHGLGLMDRHDLFGIPKNIFKKPMQTEIK